MRVHPGQQQTCVSVFFSLFGEGGVVSRIVRLSISLRFWKFGDREVGCTGIAQWFGRFWRVWAALASLSCLRLGSR